MSFRAVVLRKVPLLLIAIAVLGWIVMTLWNWIIPHLFVGTHTIDYARAIGLLVLCRVLVGGFRGHRDHKPWRRWKRMTALESDQLRRAASGGRHSDAVEDCE
jgi:hypothetical protein